MMKKMMICMMMVLAAMVMNASGLQASPQSQDNSVTSHTDIVKANHTDNYRIYFYRGEEAEVLVIGDGDTDLDLYVYDDNGNLVASDTDFSDNCYVSWTPRRSGYFTVKIKNLGNVPNCYLLMKD